MQKHDDVSRAWLSRFLDGAAGRVHFVGVCGVGMAGLAHLLHGAGLEVSGCDLAANRLGSWLRGSGVRVDEGHGPSHVGDGVELVVRSAAVPPDEPELVAASERNIPVFTRGEVLSAFRWPGLVAVGGTHGKTTTTAFIAQILKHAGRDPTWCVGGELTGCGCNGVAARGAGEVTVLEADESDGTLALYRPDVAVVTNVEFDHMENFENEAAFRDCFRSFAANAGTVIYCKDDAGAAALAQSAERGTWHREHGAESGRSRWVSYGFSEGCDVTATDIAGAGLCQEFTLIRGGDEVARIKLNAPGRHNILNGLAAAAVSLELGLTGSELAAGLGRVNLPGRRFEVVVSAGGVRVVSDYAHHPSEVAALVAAAGCLEPDRTLAVFQPHRYTRTRALGKEFPAAFKDVDSLVLLPVYAASETPLTGGTVWDLYAEFRDQGRQPGAVAVATGLEQAWGYVRQELFRDAPASDRRKLLLIVGAGDVETLAVRAREHFGRGDAGFDETWMARLDALDDIIIRKDEPLAKRTTFGVGGKADILADVDSEQGLVRLLGCCSDLGIPFHLLAGGSNVLVSDLGVRGVTARLTGTGFRRIEIVDAGRDEVTVLAGAGVPMGALLDRLESESFSGLEFLQGIPGTIGGGLRMNAGAAGDEICAHVSSIRCLNLDGSECTVNRNELRFSYRSCESLSDRVAIECTLTVRRGSSEEIAARRRELRDRRKWMAGLRCAGSIFRNPPGGSAGRLIDECGQKGRRVGSAAVSMEHGNVIVAEQGACASDVTALVEMVRSVVREKRGVMLENEIVVFGG